MTSQTKPRLAPWGWHAPNGNSGLHRRPAGSLPRSSQAEHDAITTPVPTVALLQAARAMNEPEPPADLGLYSPVQGQPVAAEQSSEGEEPPHSSSRRSGSLAADYGLEHLIADEAKPGRTGWGWMRSYGLWIVAALLLLWLSASFLMRWLATLP
jgi:hypothetical protein